MMNNITYIVLKINMGQFKWDMEQMKMMKYVAEHNHFCKIFAEDISDL